MARRGSRQRGPLRTTKEYREQRTERCINYLHRAHFSMPLAKQLAKVDHWGAPTSAWITALSKLLQEPKP